MKIPEATTPKEARRAYFRHRGALNKLLGQGAKHPYVLIANSCEYLLKNDNRWGPAVLIRLEQDSELKKTANPMAWLVGPEISPGAVLQFKDGDGGFRLQDGSNKVCLAMVVDGRHGPGGFGNASGRTSDEILATVVHEVQHALDRQHLMAGALDLDTSAAFEDFKTEFRSHFLEGIAPNEHQGSEEDFILDPTDPLSPGALRLRKVQVKASLLDNENYPFKATYQEGMRFAKRVDGFVDEFEVPTQRGGQFNGMLNALNSVRIEALLKAVEASSLVWASGPELPYIRALDALRPEERQFIRQSKDWKQLAHEKLEDGGQDFYERL